MADEPLDALGGKTPLQAARTPGMDSIAREGVSGTLLTLPDGFPTSSEVANMSVLGCDLPSEYCGRGPLEAAGRGLPLGPHDTAFRVNLTTVEDGVLTDFSGGHVAQEAAEAFIRALNDRFGNERIRFHPGVSYRNLLVLSGPGFSGRVTTEKPDDHQGEPVADFLPRAAEPQAEPTAALLRTLVREAPAVLSACPASRDLAARGRPAVSGIWPWSGGRAGTFRTLRDKYGITGVVISAVDVLLGLGRCLGMDVIHRPEFTGYTDTDYRGKCEAAVTALQSHDLVYLHLEAIDEVSHEQDVQRKVRAIEDFDALVIAPALAAAGPDVNVAVLPDHPVPVSTGKHTRTPVPVAVRIAGRAPDAVTTFDEAACRRGALGSLRNGDLMDLLFGPGR